MYWSCSKLGQCWQFHRWCSMPQGCQICYWCWGEGADLLFAWWWYKGNGCQCKNHSYQGLSKMRSKEMQPHDLFNWRIHGWHSNSEEVYDRERENSQGELEWSTACNTRARFPRSRNFWWMTAQRHGGYKPTRNPHAQWRYWWHEVPCSASDQLHLSDTSKQPNEKIWSWSIFGQWITSNSNGR